MTETETIKFARDGEGNIIDPPVHPLFEQELKRAADSGDNSTVARIHAEYEDWRRGEVETLESGNRSTVLGEQRISATPGGEVGSGPAEAPVNIDLTGTGPGNDPAPAPGNDPAPTPPGDDTTPGGGAA